MSQTDDTSGELFASDGENSEVHLTLDFEDPTPEFEMELRTLTSAFWAQTPHSELPFTLAEIVSNQPEVGTVACDDDRSVLGYHSVINMGQHLRDPAIAALFDLLLDALDQYRPKVSVVQRFWQRLETGSVTLGFLTMGRYANLPMAAIAAFYQVIKEDLDWTASSSYSSTTSAHLFKFTHMLYVTKGVLKDSEITVQHLINSSTNPMSCLKKRSLFRPEDTIIIECSLFTLLIPASLGSYTCWVISVLDLAGYMRVVKALGEEQP